MFRIPFLLLGLNLLIAATAVQDAARNYGYPPHPGVQQNVNSAAGQGFQQPPGLDFSNFFGDYFGQMQKIQEQFANKGHSYAYTNNKLNGGAKAESSLIYKTNLDSDGNGSGVGGLNGLQQLQRLASSQTGNFDQGAFAAASVGPEGSYHSAGILPENPNSPNIANKFIPASARQGSGDGGFYGAYATSFSSSSDINGKKTENREAQTTINDNGKVTTHRVKYP